MWDQSKNQKERNKKIYVLGQATENKGNNPDSLIFQHSLEIKVFLYK
jgi:hypothetical protein